MDQARGSLFRAALAAAACATAVSAAPQGVAPSVILPGDPKLALGTASPETYRVPVASTGAKLLGTSARVLLLKARDGTARPAEWVTPRWPGGDLDVRGVDLTLVVESARLPDVGEYDVVVQFAWAGQDGTTTPMPGATTKTITLVRPAPPPDKPVELVQERLGERTLGVTRSWPLGTTPETPFDFAIAATPVPALSTTGESLLSKDLSEVEAALQVQPIPSASRTDPQRIRITVPALHRAGTFVSLAHLAGPNLARPAFVPVTVKVRDAWGFPLAIIALGVAGAFLFSWFAGTWRERELFELARGLLEADVAAWEARVRATAAREPLGLVKDQIALAGRIAATGDVAKARQELQKASDALAAFAKTQAEQRAALWKEVDALSADLDRARAAGTVDAGKLRALEEAIEAVAAQLRDRNAEAAAAALPAAKAILATITLPPRAAPQGGAPAPAAPTPTAEIRPLGNPETFVARQAIVLEAVLPGRQDGDVVRWELEGHRFARTGTAVRTSFPRAGIWHVTLVVLRGDRWRRTPVAAASTAIHVLPPSAERAERVGERRLLVSSLALSAFAVVVASVTGLLALWAGKAFGTPTDYLTAFLWGFGIDGTVKGFTAVLGRLRGSQP